MESDETPHSKSSALISKASAFIEQLKEDNQRLLKLKHSGANVSIEKNEDDPEEIANDDQDEIILHLLVGVFEPKDLISPSDIQPKPFNLQTQPREETNIQSPHIIEIPSDQDDV